MQQDHRKQEIERLEREVEDLRQLQVTETPSKELERLRIEVAQLRRDLYQNLGAWQRTQLARHAQR